jgi:hypothetical protein
MNLGRLRRQALLVIAAAVALLGMGSPAFAANYPYQNCDAMGISMSSLCTEWTGGYPGGRVRTSSGADKYALRLMFCGSTRLAGCSWRVVASSTGNKMFTPSVRAAKYGWFKSCAETARGGPWYCSSNVHAVWLGD